ncbi:MAG TPA: hypothetical protein VIX35_10995 [Vicinamibacterales bacterium]
MQASLAEYVRTLVGPWVLLPASPKLPGVLSCTILSDPPRSGLQPIRLLEFYALSLTRLSSEPTSWPTGAFQLESILFDGHRLSFAASAETIQFTVDTASEVTLYACDFEVQTTTPALSAALLKAENVPLAAQQLSVEMPSGRKTLVGPAQGPIFTPPREYYIPRDLKSLLAVGFGVAFMIFGLWLVYSTGGGFFGGWMLVIVGAYLCAATILDLALFPPWRF